MKRYSSLFFRGVKYNQSAAENWNARRDVLIHYWCNASRPSKRLQAMRLLAILEERIGECLTFLREQKEQRTKQENEAQEQIIHLECPSIKCRWNPDALGVGTRMKDYEPGKIKCNICGQPLRSEADRKIENMLWDLGIQPS